jgi:hypothetical protein
MQINWLTGFQSFSLYVYPGRSPLVRSTIEAEDEVTITRLTVGACDLAAFKISVVSWIAGIRLSLVMSFLEPHIPLGKWN